MDVRPQHPNAWLLELCRRLDNGSPSTTNVPLDWSALPEHTPVESGDGMSSSTTLNPGRYKLPRRVPDGH